MHSRIGCIYLTFLHCAFSNVSSNGLSEKRQSHISCICLTFLHCAFSNVSANGLDGKRHSHIGCICLTFLHNELQTVWRCLWDKAFENTFENVQRRKVIQMQPMWLRLFSTKQFEDTFQNTQWRKCNSNLTILCLGRPLEGTLGKAQWTKV